MTPKSTIVVGMSGGVDSSVTAAILKERGYNVIGLFMKNWEEIDDTGVCPAEEDYKDVISVCEKLKIPYKSVDFIKEYRDQVFAQFLDEYERGFTPNPDILCNREIKFKVFLEKALEIGADYLATGHYCQNFYKDGEHIMAKGVDNGKDQTYFLYTINSKILKNVLFPIGDLKKSEVRKIAAKYDLQTKDKKDSTGICFIGERNFKKFLSQYIQIKTGPLKLLDGTIVGEHSGMAFYTLGQRKGLGLGGSGAPWFVVGKDADSNTVYVERGEAHPALYRDYLTANELTWVNENFKLSEPLKCKAKVRYRQPDQDCILINIGNNEIRVDFDLPQRAITPRQSIVFYRKDQCLGGAMIIKGGPSYFEQKKDLPKIIGV
ncbi:MAG: tRNA 2-thiouridine(34) synthase MnmA [Bacteriovoracaceae bacterium]|nr:tRNA 2-thiouridine(34) synthase MnmA [Bacteriovoracaceae bacterium]